MLQDINMLIRRWWEENIACILDLKKWKHEKYYKSFSPLTNKYQSFDVREWGMEGGLSKFVTHYSKTINKCVTECDGCVKDLLLCIFLNFI